MLGRRSVRVMLPGRLELESHAAAGPLGLREPYRRAAAGFLGPWAVRITRPGGSGRPRRFRTEPATPVQSRQCSTGRLGPARRASGDVTSYR